MSACGIGGSVANIFECGGAEAFGELREVEALRGDGLALRFDVAGGQRCAVSTATVAVWHGLTLQRAAIAHGPGDGAGGLLDDEVAGGAVPDDAPAHGPAVAGAHDAAVDEVNAAATDGAVVDE